MEARDQFWFTLIVRINAIHSWSALEWDSPSKGNGCVSGKFCAERTGGIWHFPINFFESLEGWRLLPQEMPEQLYIFLYNNLPGKGATRLEEARLLWCPFWMQTKKSNLRLSRDWEKARYPSLENMFDFVKEIYDKIWIGKGRAVLDVWLGWLSALIKFSPWVEGAGKAVEILQKMSLNGKDLPSEMLPKLLGSMRSTVVWRLHDKMISPWRSLFLFTDSNTYVYHLNTKWTDLAKALPLEDI